MGNPALNLHEAYLRGDMEAVRRELGDPEDFPHTRDECGTSCLIYALYYGPLSLVREMLDLGADPNEPVGDGFPPVFAALSSNRTDATERTALLLSPGADPRARTRIDHYATALEEAEHFGHHAGAAALRRAGISG